MTSVPLYFPALAGLSAYILGHQQGHIGQVKMGNAQLNPGVVLLVSITGVSAMVTLLGLAVYFWVLFGWLAALKFVGFSFLFQAAAAVVVSSLHLLKYAWAISLSGIVVLPVLIGVMLYVAVIR